MKAMKATRTMKRLAAALLLVAVAAGSAGCGQTGDGTMSLEEGTKKYLSVRKIGDDRLISLGMSREEVEKVTGEAIFEERFDADTWRCGYGDELYVAYNEMGIAIFLALNIPEEAAVEYETTIGLRAGDSLETAQAAYNNHLLTLSEIRYHVYMRKLGKKWKILDMTKDEASEFYKEHYGKKEVDFDAVQISMVNLEGSIDWIKIEVIG